MAGIVDDIDVAENGVVILLILAAIGIVIYVIYEIKNYDPANPSGPVGTAVCDLDLFSTCGAKGSGTNTDNYLTKIGNWLDSELGLCTANEDGYCQ